MPVELAESLGIKGGDKVKETSARSHYLAKAFVTQAHQALTRSTARRSIRSVFRSIRASVQSPRTRAATRERWSQPAVADRLRTPTPSRPSSKGFLVKLEKA